MGAKYTPGQAKATKTYMKDKHVFKVIVKEEKAEKYIEAAKKAGKSLNQFFIDCIDKGMT